MSSTGSYSQDFNTLISSGTGTWADNSTIPNVYSQRTGTGTTIVANDGSSSAGNLYSYGTGTNGERSLGSVGSGGGTAGSFAHGIQLQNTSSVEITDLTVSYTLEQWRNSAAAGQAITVHYRVSSTSNTSLNPNNNAGWTAVSALNATSPITGGTAGFLNGNLPANQVVRSNIQITSLTIPAGHYIMIKWDDPNHTGDDHGLSIDDVTIQWTVNETPPCTPPTIQASNLDIDADPTEFLATWTAGNGVGALVVISQGAPLNTLPVNGTSYVGNNTFGVGAALGNGFVIGTANDIIDGDGLSPQTTYHLSIFEYSEATPGEPCYLTPALTGQFTTPAIPTSITHIGTSPASSDIENGTNDVILYQVEIQRTGGAAALNALELLTDGTWEPSDVTNFKLRYSTDANLDVSDPSLATILGTTFASGGVQILDFVGINQNIPSGSSYLFITADIALGAVGGRTIAAEVLADADFTYSVTPVYTGSSFAVGNPKTIIVNQVPEIQIAYPGTTPINCGSTINLGSVALGSQSDFDVQIQNVGLVDLLINNLPLTVVGSADFVITVQPASPIAASGSEVVSLSFIPSTIGSINASITILSNDADEASCVINLTGTGTAPQIQLQNPINTNIACGATVSFGNVTVSTNSTQTVRIRNTGTASLIVDLPLVINSPNGDFSITTQPTSPIAAGGFSDFVVQFSPLAAGASTADISITSNSQSNATCIVNFSGNGAVEPLYRSKQSGAFNANSTWEVSTDGGLSYQDAITTPTSTNNVGIQIRNPHVVTSTATVSIDQVVIEAGATLEQTGGTITFANGAGTDLQVFGTLRNSSSSNFTVSTGATIVFENGSLYNHNRNAGAIPTAEWKVGSKVLVTNLTQNMPTGLNQAFYDIEFDNVLTQSVNASGNLTTVLSDLIIAQTRTNTGNQEFRFASGSANTTTIGGNFIIGTDALVVLTSGTGASTVSVNGNVTVQSGGVLTLTTGSGAGTLNVNGNVFVEAGGTLIVSGAGGAGNLNVNGNFITESGSTVTLTNTSGNGTINAKGNVEIAGTLNGTSGSGMKRIDLTGTSIQGLLIPTTTAAVTINLNNAAGAILLGDANWAGPFNMINGTLRTSAFDFSPSGTFTGFGSSRYICTCDAAGQPSTGSLQLDVTSADPRLFPVGPTPTLYMPITYEPVVGHVTGVHSARVEELGADGVTPLIPEQCVQYQWILDRVSGSGSNVQLVFEWPASTEGVDFDIDDAPVVGRWFTDRFRPISNATKLTDFSVRTDLVISEFSPFVVASNREALPVTWLEVKAVQSGKSEVTVHWSTTSEVNNDYFEVERSIDGRNFTTLGRVASQIGGRTINYYSFVDDTAPNGILIYRIKQVDIDGAFSYSPLTSVRVSGQNELRVRHTLIEQTVFVEGIQNEAVVRIFNATGQLYLQTRTQTGEVYIGNLPTGLYQVYISENGAEVIEKVFKQ